MNSLFFGGPLEQVIYQWGQFGIFSVILPFILVFSIVFAIFEKINLFKNNKAVHVIIALAIAFFTIANPYVVSFFTPIFSNLGLGVAILVALLVVMGLAVKPDSGAWKMIFLVIGILIFIMVLINSGVLGHIFRIPVCDAYCQAIVLFVVVIGIAVGVAVFSGKPGEKNLLKEAMGAGS